MGLVSIYAPYLKSSTTGWYIAYNVASIRKVCSMHETTVWTALLCFGFSCL